jgi:hypothetical protein
MTTTEYPEDVRQYDDHPASPFFHDWCPDCSRLAEECVCNASQEEA